MTQRNPQPLPCRNCQVGEEMGKYNSVALILNAVFVYMGKFVMKLCK